MTRTEVLLEEELRAALAANERDRSIVIDTYNALSDEIARRNWLFESRGNYEWNDDKYRLEFRAAIDALAVHLETLRKIGADITLCPTDHESVQRARNPLLYIRPEALAMIRELGPGQDFTLVAKTEQTARHSVAIHVL